MAIENDAKYVRDINGDLIKVEVEEEERTPQFVEEQSPASLSDTIYLFARGQDKGIVLYVKSLEDGKCIISGSDFVTKAEIADDKVGVWSNVRVFDGNPYRTMTKIVSPGLMLGYVAQMISPTYVDDEKNYQLLDFDISPSEISRRVTLGLSRDLEPNSKEKKMRNFMIENLMDELTEIKNPNSNFFNEIIKDQQSDTNDFDFNNDLYNINDNIGHKL